MSTFTDRWRQLNWDDIALRILGLHLNLCSGSFGAMVHQFAGHAQGTVCARCDSEILDRKISCRARCVASQRGEQTKDR